MICESAEEANNPEIVLYRMRQICLAPSLGGWHDFSQQDYPSYVLNFPLTDDVSTECLVNTLHTHPAWPAMSFVSGLSELALVFVVRHILDPRWYIDPEFPDRVGQLQFAMGLQPSVQRQIYDEDAKHTAAMAKCRWVLDSWKDKEPVGYEWEEPGYFLWRIWRDTGGGSRGDLKASQKFIVFLRHSWLDAMYSNTTSSGSDPLFAPDMLFHRADEVEAYKQHMQRYRDAN
jgi:hypothetical protein